ncbi:MAG: hypothetical protein ABIF82_10495 [Planctomycetota bacterium]
MWAKMRAPPWADERQPFALNGTDNDNGNATGNDNGNDNGTGNGTIWRTARQAL